MKRLLGLPAIVAAASILGTGAAAQSLEDVVATGPLAERGMERNALSHEVAERIAQACQELAASRDGSVSIFILNQYGSIVHAHSMDGQQPINIDTALMKARTALWWPGSTRQRANAVAQNPFGQIRMIQLDAFPVPGGLPIVVEGQLLGTIGVGGGFNVDDEECAHHALTEVLGPQPPLVEPYSPDNAER